MFTGSELEESKFRIAKVSDPCTIFNGSTKYNCTRDARLANLFIEEDYKVSNRSRYYLGEWHTHPEDNPQPSNIDVASIKIYILRQNFLLMEFFDNCWTKKQLLWFL